MSPPPTLISPTSWTPCACAAPSSKTLVAVLHDLNQAARYADHVIALNEGRVIATGSPEEVVTSEIVRSVFNVDALVIPDPVTGRPLIVPTEKELPARG